MQLELNKYYSVVEVSEKLKIKTNTVQSLVNRGVIDLAIRYKRKPYYFTEQVDFLVDFLTSSICLADISRKIGVNVETIKKYAIKLHMKILDNPMCKAERRITLQDYDNLIVYFKENNINMLNVEKFVSEIQNLSDFFDYSYIREVFIKIRYYNYDAYSGCIINATKVICKDLNVPFVLSKDHKNIFINNKYKELFTKHMMFLNEIISSEDYCSIKYVRNTMGLKIEKRTLKNKLKSFYCKGTIWFKKEDIHTLINKRENTMTLAEVTKLIKARNKDIVFRLIKNEGVKFINEGRAIYIYKSDFNIIKEQFEFSKRLERVEDRYDRYKLLVEGLHQKNKDISDTLLLFDTYIIGRLNKNKNNTLVTVFVSMYKFFINSLKKNLYNYDSKLIEKLFKMVVQSPKFSQSFKAELVNFYNYCLKERNVKKDYLEKKAFSLPRHSLTESKRDNNKPYTKEQFLNLWGLVFLNVDNAEYLNKAINNRTLAMAWLYLALHYVTMWRSNTIRNIPIPHLGVIGFSNGEDFINWLKDNIGNFTEDMGQKICNNVKLKIDSFEIEASKNDELLTFEVGRTMVRQVGLLLTLCEAHRQLAMRSSNISTNANVLITSTIKTGRDYYTKLFGKKFSMALGGEDFSNMRATKSYANFIIDNSEEGKKGISEYIITLMRSHKMNRYMYAESNQYYEDRTVDKTIEEIELNLFDIGTFGFAKHKLLSILKKGFNLLGTSEQIKIIKDLEITPYEAEVIIKTIDAQRKIINELIFKMSVNSGLIKEILRLISQGQANAKHHHTQCLLRAILHVQSNGQIPLNSLKDIIDGNLEKLKCIRSESDTCFGCPLLIGEIYFLFELNEVIENTLVNLEKTNDNFEKYMYSKMIFEGYLPIIAEAYEEFGIEKVKSFIDTENFSTRIKSLEENGGIILRLKGDYNANSSKKIR